MSRIKIKDNSRIPKESLSGISFTQIKLQIKLWSSWRMKGYLYSRKFLEMQMISQRPDDFTGV